MRGLVLTAVLVVSAVLTGWCWIYRSYDNVLKEASMLYENGEFVQMKDVLNGYSGSLQVNLLLRIKLFSKQVGRLAYVNGVANARLGNIDEAEQNFRKSADSSELKIGANSLYNTAEYMIVRGELEAAADTYRQALVLVPGDVQTQINLELLLQKIEQRSKKEKEQKKGDEGEAPSDLWIRDIREDGTNNGNPKRIWR